VGDGRYHGVSSGGDDKEGWAVNRRGFLGKLWAVPVGAVGVVAAAKKSPTHDQARKLQPGEVSIANLSDGESIEVWIRRHVSPEERIETANFLAARW
jgi:hypothetical protein